MASSVLVFFVNGKKVIEEHVNPEWTLLYYLRNKLNLCGTKLGCGEGGCGACTVMVSRYDKDVQVIKHFAVNACLAPICSMHGLAVTTIEGIGSTKTKLHPVQERIAKAHGLQCGFCTPGIEMSMYTLLRNTSRPTMEEMQTSFQGNLCRCTGYRPIIEGYKSFTSDTDKHMTNGFADISDSKECSMGQNCCKFNGIQENIPNQMFDSSTFQPYDPTQEPIFPPELKLYNTFNTQYLIFKGEHITWYRPTTLTDLLDLKDKYPEAKIVVGNTEIGVEVKIKRCQYPILIQSSLVPELNKIEVTDNGIKIGASVTLQEIEQILNKAISEMPEHKTRIFVAVRDMLHWFGSKQIRNVASMGGNIMTSSPISDLNPILIAAEVQLELLSKKRGKRMVTLNTQFFTGYRKNAVEQDEILTAIHIPITMQWQYFYAYKQSRRRDDDIAIVNFAINVIFRAKSNVVQHIVIACGGMAPTTIIAASLGKFLVNKSWNQETLELAYKYLVEDFKLPPNAPGGMAEYRQTITLSLFFKAFLRVSEQMQAFISNFEGYKQDASVLCDFQTQIPKSSQYFDIHTSRGVARSVGKLIPHKSAFTSATGEAVYCDDIPKQEGELYMALVISTKANARILDIDASEALKCKGVHAFFTHKDIPKSKNITGIGEDEEIFVSSVASCQGLVLGIVVADDQLIAQRAASLVQVTYKVLQPIIVSIEDAIHHNSFFESPNSWETGDINNVFKTAPHVLEGDCRTGTQEHFYLETHCTLAVPKKEDHEMEIFCATQDAAHVTVLIAKLLDVPQNRIITKVKRVGGAFGGKETRSYNLPILAAFAAHKLNRPVRCMLNRDEDMVITGTRNAFYSKYKIAFDDYGKILGCEVNMYANGGYSKDVSFAILERAMYHFESAYRIPVVRAVGYVCKTNLPSCTAFRAFGAPQAIIVGENMIRQIAEFLNKDILEVQYLNLFKEGDPTTYNQFLNQCHVSRCLNECITNAEFVARKKEVETFNRKNRWRKRGITMTPIRYAIGVNIPHYNQAGALIHVYTDGSVLLAYGGIEMGQGLHTKMIQVASTVLEISHTKIHISETSSDKVPNSTGTLGSIGSELFGAAVMNASEIIKERLKPYKEKYPDKQWEDWVKAAYYDRVSLSTTGFYKNPSTFAVEDGTIYDYHTYGASCSEVEIDCLTGEHQVLRTDIVMDVGESLNPAIDVGQIEGAFMQGYGLYVQEEMLYSPNGEILTKGPGSYKIPSFGNLPLEFNVSLLKGSSNPKAIYSSKAIGEPPLLLSCSVLFAIREAIKAARTDAGLEPCNFKLDAPATVAKIRMACEDHLTAMIEKHKPGSYIPWNVVP